MRRNLIWSFLLALFVVSAAMPVWADVSIEELLVRREGASVNLRINVHNTGAESQKGPVMISLYVRKDANDTWQLLKQWNEASLAAGNRLARDYFDPDNQYLTDLAHTGSFQVKATVTAPGIEDVARETSWSDNESGKDKPPASDDK
jgi:hypothetical protein